MLHGYRVYDADAHAIMSPAMWQDLPGDFVAPAAARGAHYRRSRLGPLEYRLADRGQHGAPCFRPRFPCGQYSRHRHGRVGNSIECR